MVVWCSGIEGWWAIMGRSLSGSKHRLPSWNVASFGTGVHVGDCGYIRTMPSNTIVHSTGIHKSNPSFVTPV